MKKKMASKPDASTVVAKQKKGCVPAIQPAHQEAGGEVPPFIKTILPDGKVVWSMSAPIAKRLNELHHTENIEDEEVQTALIALLMADFRFMNNKDGDAEDYENRPVHRTESAQAFTGFLMPLAKRLYELRKPENRISHRRNEIKAGVEAWFREVVEKAYAESLQTTPWEQLAINVIDATWRLCEELGRHATKKDVKELSGLKWGKTQWKDLFKEAGLEDLHEAGKERY